MLAISKFLPFFFLFFSARYGIDQVLKLMEENSQLTEAADAFEERLHHETRRAEKRRMSAENRAELEVCKEKGIKIG